MNKIIEKEKLTEKINAAYRNSQISRDDIKDIMKNIQELYALDVILFTTNNGYKYYFLPEVALGNPDEIEKTVNVAMTREQYKEVADQYAHVLFSEEPLESLKKDFEGSILHSGIICNQEYFGSIVFWTKQTRIWNDEEKQTLLELKQLILIYYGIRQLTYGMTPYRMAMQEMKDEKILSSFYLNLVSGKCHVIKLVDFLKDNIGEWSNYSELLTYYTTQYTDPVYSEVLLEDFNLNHVRQTISANNPIIYIEYPRKFEKEVSWIRFQIELVESKQDGTPYHAIVTFKDITQDIQNRALLSRSTNKAKKSYVVISSVDLENGRYDVYVDNREAVAESTEYEDYEGYGQYTNLIRDITRYNIDPKYAGRFVKRFSIETMREHFDSSSYPIQYDFPFHINGEEFWVRMEAVRSEQYGEKDRKVLLYFSDITKKKHRELQMEEKKALLEKENELKKFQLEHDSLTGVYNRQGYNSILEKYKEDHRPVAYIQIDVDNFKMVNDSYGHAFGDAVLKQVAAQLTETFRAEDQVFRFGGDEFAVLLINCQTEAWNAIEHKQRMIHIRMNQYLHKNIYVTLSMGISWSLSGFHQEMIALADEALYHTKNNGRAGCSVINDKHEIIYEWNDEMRDETEANPLAQSGTGAYRMELSKDNVWFGRLVCNETARALIGLSETMTPEENYNTWVKRIDPLYIDTVIKMRDEMIEQGQAECTYGYLHPTQGRIMVRSGGKAVNNKEGIVFYGYHQSLQGTTIVLQDDESRKLIAAMNSLYFCSYYIALKEDQFYTFKATVEAGELESQEGRASIAIKSFIDVLVSPEHRESMLAFVDLATLQDRMAGKPFLEQEYLSVTDKGWCRSRFFPIDYDEAGNLSHVQFMIASIDKSKREEIEREKWIRDAMRLQVRIGEIVSKSSVMQSGLMDKKTGTVRAWNHMDFMKEGKTYSFEYVKQANIRCLREEDIARFEKEFDLDEIKRKVEEKGSYSITYRMKNKEGNLIVTSLHIEECVTDPEKFLAVREDITDVVPEGINKITEFDILESMNETVAIIDYYDYNIVYMNKKARDAVGMDMHTLRAKKCYEVFGDTGSPCAFCDKQILGKGANGFSVRTLKGSNQNTFVHGCILELNGRKYRMEQGVPVSDIDVSVDHLQGLLATEQKLMDCVQNLIHITDVGEAIEYLLDQIIGYYNCDRACLSILTGDHKGTVVTERCNAGVSRKFVDGEVLPLTDFMQWETVHSPIKLQKVYCDGDESEEQRWMKEVGLDNLMILSFEFGQEEIGYISIDNLRQHKEDSNWIGTLAFFIANELQKQ